eukprot:c27521_g1_i2 orf=56-1723(+)
MACTSTFPLSLLFASIALVAASPYFYESFDDESWEDRWILSEKDDYQGKWKRAISDGHEDYGLLVTEKARKYAIAVDLPELIELKKHDVVLQYDVRLQDGLECGGAYLKFLRPQESGWVPKQFDSESPYSIMFGPDKCGATNKVHFIFNHKHPKSGKYIEHHLRYPPTPINDKNSHVYTAIIYSNNTLKMLVDGEDTKTVDLLSNDFEPAIFPPKTIPDPEDKKPEDWDERAKISDPEAKKPDDWDEDAPMDIEDTEAEKPEGWLDDEAEEIDNPEALKPEDWDEEEDGEWEAPKIPNPKCEEAPGCGKWTRPTRRNPAYKGKWYPPMIDNPNYNGIWKPQQIPNPDYFELEYPNLEPVSVIGIEIWTMQEGILFDNILITEDEKEAEQYRQQTWKVKFEAEKEKQKVEESTEVTKPGLLSGLKGKLFELLRSAADAQLLSSYRPTLIEAIEKGEANPNVTLGILVTVVLFFLTVFYKLLCGGKRPPTPTVPVEIAKKEDISTPDDTITETKEEPVGGTVENTNENENENETSGEIEKEGDESSGTRHRRTRRET